MKYLNLIFLLLSGSLFLSACQQDTVRPEDSPYALFPNGSILVQHEAITLPANTYDLTIQNGVITRHDGLDWREAHCLLESNTSFDSNQTLKSGEYRIIHSRRHHEETSLPLRMAGLMPVKGDATKIIVLTLDLRSEQNPSIVRMTCNDWGYYFDDQFLSLNQVRATLQPLFSIRLPGQQ